MDVLIGVAAKSLLIAGGVLLLLKLMHKRSASDRSLIAHLGLLALLLLPVATVALPTLDVEAAFVPAPQVVGIPKAGPAGTSEVPAAMEAAPPPATFPVEQAVAPQPIDWLFWGYAAPAGLLLLLTLIALARLFALKSRASVLVDTHWLSALAHAQRRMNFKHGTALLTSDDLPSPISWGLMRPVILLNSDAVNSRREAEAIIAHELAHVASLDWAKLLLARVTVALFWFNPLVWLLSREAHQLREEAADDAVLQSDIEDTDYANLLVDVARHECRGLLIGAHGVAPGRNSLSRRVRRVLDGALARAPGGWRWTSAVAFFAAGMAVPIATLQLVPVAAASVAPTADADTQPAARRSEARAAAAETKAVAAAAASAPTLMIAPARGKEPTEIDVDADVDPDIDIDMPAVGGAVPLSNGGTIRSADQIEAISISGGGQVVVRNGAGNSVRVVRGRGSINAAEGSVSVSCHRDCGNFLVEVTASRLEALAVQGGGVIRIADPFPKVPDLALAIVGGGRIDARLARGSSVAAATQGGGTILTTATGELAASTTGGGEIRYWGTNNVATSVQGGGRIVPGD